MSLRCTTVESVEGADLKISTTVKILYPKMGQRIHCAHVSNCLKVVPMGERVFSSVYFACQGKLNMTQQMLQFVNLSISFQPQYQRANDFFSCGVHRGHTSHVL